MRKYYTHILLILLGLFLYFMANFQRVAVPGAIFDSLQSDLLISPDSVTALGSIFMYSYAVSLLFCGILSDRYGAIKVIMCGACLFAIGSLIFPNTKNIYLLYFSRAILGIGAATFYLCLVQEAKKCFPDKYFSISVSLMLIIGYIGGFCANAPLIYMTNFYKWQSIFNFLAISTVILTLLFCLERIFLHHIPVNEHAKFSIQPFKEVLANKFNRNLYVYAGLNYGLYYVLQTIIGGKFLKDYINLSTESSALILSLMIIVTGISGFTMATLNSITKNKQIFFMKTVCIMSTIIFAVIPTCIFFNIKGIFIAFLVLMIAIGGGMSPILVSIIHAKNKYEIRGTALSIMNCFFFLSVGFMGTIAGFILKLYPPLKIVSGQYIYSDKSYFWVFLVFFIFALIEMYNVFKLKEN